MKAIVIALLFGGLLFTACKKVTGEGPTVTQQRPVAGFTKISAGIGGKIFYTTDTVYKLEVQAQQNILDVLQTNIVGNELVIKVKDGYRIKDAADIIIKISAPAPESVNLSGSGDLQMTGNLAATNCNLRISGSGSLHIDRVTNNGELAANISGSGRITIQNGTAASENLRISGSGHMELSNVVAATARTEISGSGDIKLHVTNNLHASISGSGWVYYHGTPQVSSHISGSGKVRPF